MKRATALLLAVVLAMLATTPASIVIHGPAFHAPPSGGATPPGTPTLWLSDTGSSASTWPDLSGNGYDATQATSSKQASIIPSGIGGLQSRRFDGVDDFLNTPDIGISGQPYTICTVVKSANATPLGHQMFTASGGPSFAGVLLTTSSGFAIYAGSNVLITGGGTVDTSPHIIIGTFNGGSSFVTIDGNVFGSGNPGSAGLGVVGIGGLQTIGGQHFEGDISAVIIYPVALSTGVRKSLEAYCGTKFTIPVAP